VTPGVWSNGPTSYSYRWQDCTTSPGTSTGVQVLSGGGYDMTLPTTGSCSDATGVGAASNRYTVGSSDVGKALAVRVTATNGGGSTSTTVSGSCATGLMTTAVPAQTSSQWTLPPASTYFDNGERGCSPISAVVGTGQYGTGTSGEHFCTNAPITCGFADIANTGPPVGTTLYSVPGTCTSPLGPGSGCGNTGSGWSYSSGKINLTSGATLKDVSFNGTITVSGLSNVTIEDNALTHAGPSIPIVNVSGTSSAITIQNNNFSGSDATTVGDACDGGIWESGYSATNVTFSNNNMWYCAAFLNGISSGGWTIENNYIHDFAFAQTGNHLDGIQFQGNANGITTPLYFRHNTVLMDFWQTSPVIPSNDDNQAETNRQVIHNLLAGGDYCLYVAGKTQYPTTNSTFAANNFSSIYFGASKTGSTDACASWGGPVSYWTASTNTWSGNIWDDNGTTVNP
jgi:hypothetical protein